MALGNHDSNGDAEFVKGLYRDILGREPEKSGLDWHKHLLEGGMSRDAMRSAILNSKEAKNRGGRTNPGKPANPSHPAAPPAGNNPPPAVPGGPAFNGPLAAIPVRKLDGAQGFLWKPVGENSGKLAVLLPKDLWNSVSNVTLYGPDGKKLESVDTQPGYGLDGRTIFRFSRSGANYPPGTSVVATKGDGTAVRWIVKDTGNRAD